MRLYFAQLLDVGYCGIKHCILRLCVNFADRIVCEENASVIEWGRGLGRGLADEPVWT